MTELSMVLVTLTDGIHAPENEFICFMFLLSCWYIAHITEEMCFKIILGHSITTYTEPSSSPDLTVVIPLNRRNPDTIIPQLWASRALLYLLVGAGGCYHLLIWLTQCY